MFIDDDAVRTLTKLGLTGLESKVYIVLCRYGKMSTKKISKFTSIAQSDIYRIVKSLQQKGLIEKQIERPISYKSVPFEAGSNFLLERKKAEIKVLYKETKKLSRKIKKNSADKPPISEESHFLMIPRRENVVKKIGEAIDRSKSKVDLCLSWKRFYNGINRIFAESSARAWKRGVTFRIAVEAPREVIAQKKAVEFCKKSPFCNIRFIPEHPKTVMGIYDDKEVFVIVNPQENLFNSPALWSNNQSLITAIQQYFDYMWLISMKKPNKNSA